VYVSGPVNCLVVPTLAVGSSWFSMLRIIGLVILYALNNWFGYAVTGLSCLPELLGLLYLSVQSNTVISNMNNCLLMPLFFLLCTST
jgi:hypothetical protein